MSAPRTSAPRVTLFDASSLGVAYYANSYVCRPAEGEEDAVIAWSEHEGDRFPAAVRRGAAVGVQFHPEKSSAQGLAFVRAFVDEIRDSALGTRDSVTASTSPVSRVPSPEHA